MAKSNFDFIQYFVDPNSIFIKNHYVYFKHSHPKPAAKEIEDTSSAKVQEVTVVEQARQIAESKEEIETGKRKLPDNPAIDTPGEIKKRRKRSAVVYEPDALD